MKKKHDKKEERKMQIKKIIVTIQE